MICLAIDTSTRAGVVAIHSWDESAEENTPSRTLAELLLDVEVVHGRRLLPSIDALLRLTDMRVEDLDALALVAGPGSFTGLRIGLATLQAFASPHDLPIAPLSSMEVLASGTGPTDRVIRPALHARRDHVYTAAFRWAPSRPERLEPDREVTVDDFAASVTEPALVVGNAAPMHQPLWSEALGNLALFAEPTLHNPSGRHLGRMAVEAIRAGEALPARDVRVEYLGPSQAEVNFMARQQSPS